MADVLWTLLGLGVIVAVLAPLFWADRRHNRVYPKGMERIRNPEAAGATRRFETMLAVFSGRGGSGG